MFAIDSLSFSRPSARLRRTLAVAAGLLAGLGAAAAQAAIPIEHWTASTGARVYFVRSPSIPMLDINVDFDAGSRYDPPGKAGLATLTAALLDKGTGAVEGQPARDEAQIADAFAEARDTGAFLVFDEADSLLGDRRGAHRGWEVSQVNEMLTWMEGHPLPFACTTNLAERLDPASMRRFLVKARFGYLRPDQAATAFARFFGLPAPAALARLDQLTPADFALARRRAALLDTAPEPEMLVALLAAESAGRDGGRRIGFAA